MKNITFTVAIVFSLSLLSCQAEKAHDESEAASIESAVSVEEELSATIIKVKDLKILLDTNSEIVLLDVRHPEEIAEGTLPGNKFYAEYGGDGFEASLDGLDRSVTYYVYCHAGRRAGNTQTIMQNMGFKNVINVEGGIYEWIKEGYAIEK